MTLSEFETQVKTIENKSCFMCRHFNINETGYSKFCKKCEELTGDLIMVTAENTCSFFEKRITPKEVIERFNVKNLKEKQDKNCRVCNKSETVETDKSGQWFGKCKMVQELGAFIDDTSERIVCDCFEGKQ